MSEFIDTFDQTQVIHEPRLVAKQPRPLPHPTYVKFKDFHILDLRRHHNPLLFFL